MADMQDLIARLEKAEGPSRELDARIWSWEKDDAGRDWKEWLAVCAERGGKIPEFTASIDAALTLADADRWFDALSEAMYGAKTAAELPRQLCIAALRARAA